MSPAISCARARLVAPPVLTQLQTLHDPDLTELGHEQARAIPGNALCTRNVQIIVASPLRRTLRTATLGFHEHASTSMVPILALPELQEAGPNPCDTGSETRTVRQLFPHVDTSLCYQGWNLKEGRNLATHDAHIERAKWVRRWLREREETEIAVVSHWGFLFYLSVADPLANLTDGWRNTECKTFTFRSEDDEDALLELMEDVEPPLSHESLPVPIAA